LWAPPAQPPPPFGTLVCTFRRLLVEEVEMQGASDEWREDKPEWASGNSHGRKPVDSAEHWVEPPQGAIKPTCAVAVTFGSIAPCGASSRFAPSPTGLRPWLVSNARHSAG